MSGDNGRPALWKGTRFNVLRVRRQERLALLTLTGGQTTYEEQTVDTKAPAIHVGVRL